jgi:hypothetical protein
MDAAYGTGDVTFHRNNASTILFHLDYNFSMPELRHALIESGIFFFTVGRLALVEPPSAGQNAV